MKVLVVNVGSTSLKYNFYDMDTEAGLAAGRVERIGTPEAVHVTGSNREPSPAMTTADALREVIGRVTGGAGRSGAAP